MKRTLSRLAALLAPLLLVALVAAGGSAPASAVPGGGASPDTPGTSASVSPRQLSAGSVLSFRVSGFPGGETLYIKIDDGQLCSASSVHGACVVHQQAIPASGTVSGSFVLPSDVPRGKHWLRFLASEEVTKADGSYGGTKGYTRRGGSDFTVVAGATTSTEENGTTTSGSTSSTSPSTDGSVGTVAAGDTLVVALPRDKGAAEDEIAEVPPEKTAQSAAAEEPASTTPQADAPEAVAGSPFDGVPVVGLAGLTLMVLLAGGLLARSRRARA